MFCPSGVISGVGKKTGKVLIKIKTGKTDLPLPPIPYPYDKKYIFGIISVGQKMTLRNRKKQETIRPASDQFNPNSTVRSVLTFPFLCNISMKNSLK